jgi:hypothetical protein
MRHSNSEADSGTQVGKWNPISVERPEIRANLILDDEVRCPDLGKNPSNDECEERNVRPCRTSRVVLAGFGGLLLRGFTGGGWSA